MNNVKQRDWPSRVLTAVALLGLMGLTYGQGEPISDLTPGTGLLELKEPPRMVVKASPKRVPVKITDDGRQGDERATTAQLIFAFESGRAHLVTVYVFDEQGRMVRQRTLTSKPGRIALAMDVKDLREGRYVARVVEGESAILVRFHR